MSLSNGNTYLAKMAMEKSKEKNPKWIQSIDAGIRLFEHYEKHERFNRKSVKQGPKISQGSFGKVYRAMFQDKHVAIKVVDQENIVPSQLIEELEGLMMFHHPAVLRAIGAFYDVQSFFIMDLACGTLKEICYSTTNSLSLYNQKRYYLQLMSGVEHIHSKNMIHKDLRSENILIMANGNLKISDFGFLKKLDQSGKFKDSRRCCTICYTPKEVWQSGVFSKNSDMFAIGVCGHPAFYLRKGPRETEQEIIFNQVQGIWIWNEQKTSYEPTLCTKLTVKMYE